MKTASMTTPCSDIESNINRCKIGYMWSLLNIVVKAVSMRRLICSSSNMALHVLV